MREDGEGMLFEWATQTNGTIRTVIINGKRQSHAWSTFFFCNKPQFAGNLRTGSKPERFQVPEIVLRDDSSEPPVVPLKQGAGLMHTIRSRSQFLSARPLSTPINKHSLHLLAYHRTDIQPSL
jgi:hypothetical protein